VAERVSREVPGTRVRRVRLEIGARTGLVAEALEFGYDLCCQGTALEGSTLVIEHIPGRARCRSCAQELETEDWVALCPCGSADLEWLTGDELRIRDVEVE
jgi:hydrogenase nickel incorporation protein HypA/HybF